MRDEGSSGSNDDAQGPRATIWGTNVNTRKTQKGLYDFFKEFRQEGTDEPYYLEYLTQLVEFNESYVNLDCKHVQEWDGELYKQVVEFPAEVIPIVDLVLNTLVGELFPNSGVHVEVRPFNLQKENRLRDLDPLDIDKLVAIKGMVTRTSAVIPDIRVAFFECASCAATKIVQVDRGQISEPTLCDNQHCQAKESFQMIHNRCNFLDKQIVRLQEAPEDMPEGETPQTVSMCTWGKMVDVAKPGDRVEVTGIYRALPVRDNPRHRTVRSLYKTYVDIMHVRKIEKGKLQNESDIGADGKGMRMPTDESNELEAAGDERVQEIVQLSQHEDLYEKLAEGLCPSVWELHDIKKGVLLQLFGATNKQIDQEANGGSSRKRGEMNCLLVGDPGTSKSQILQYVHKVAPRGIYTSGKGSSAVGLTAYVTRDPETKQFVLESGALVLSDRGVCCIDEFDKMSEGARSILHEAMEQQTVSIAKAGIICSLNARTSVLAAANPIDSKYDPKKSVVENINLPPSLLSRFDLIFLVLDKPDERTDAQLARHLVALYRLDRQPPAAAVNQKLLCDYISYARREVHPKISQEAASALVKSYVELRGLGGNRKVISATPRQLESLIRLSEAHARMRLSQKVEESDVEEAVRLMKDSMQTAAMDPKTGTIDMEIITTGRSAASRKFASELREQMRNKLRGRGGETISLADLAAEASDLLGIPVEPRDMEDALGMLERDAIVRVTRNVVHVI